MSKDLYEFMTLVDVYVNDKLDTALYLGHHSDNYHLVFVDNLELLPAGRIGSNVESFRILYENE